MVAVSAAAALTTAAVTSAPPALVNDVAPPEVGADAGAWLAAAEREAGAGGAIIPGTEKRIRWYGGRDGRVTPYSIVYLHGFSATRQEIAPVGAMLADALGANLFETRLTGHGLSAAPLAGVRAEDWVADGAEALAVGARTGERIILMGTSTGATLALAMADQAAFDKVAALVLMSPNFYPRDGGARLLTWPGGPQLAALIVGETRTWTPANAAQARYWSTSYPLAAVVEMMRLVAHVRDSLPLTVSVPLLTFYSPNDSVVDVDEIGRSLSRITSPLKRTVLIERSGDPGNHVLAGDILAPANNRRVVDEIVRFVEGDGL